jgi:hypothetical protein
MDLNFNGLPNDDIHVLGLSGEDRAIMKLNAMSSVDAVFSHGRLVWMFKMDVPLMLLQPCINRTACLPNVDLTALTGDSVYTQCLKSQVFFDWPEETRYFLGGRPIDLILCRDSTLLIRLNVVPT